MHPTEDLETMTGPAERLRQLAHDLRSPLSILSMGIETLKLVRSDAQQFESICDMLSQEGVDALKELINRLAEEAEQMRAAE